MNPLFQTVLENPSNMHCRLVYADWLDDRGDPQADLIRLQIALERVDSSEEKAQMQRRATELLQRYRRRWNAPLHQMLSAAGLRNWVGRRRPLRNWRYRRGFVESVRLEAFAFCSHGATIFHLGPLRRLQLLNVRDHLGTIIASPWFGRLEQIGLVLNQWPARSDLEAIMQALQKENAPQVDFFWHSMRAPSATELSNDLVWLRNQKGRNLLHIH